MDKTLARKLGVLLDPKVQEALTLVLEDRKALNLKSSLNAQDDVQIYRYQGRAIENDWLLDLRSEIIARAES